MDRLKDLFRRQIGFQYLIGNFPLIIERQKYINEQALALIVETTEALQETNWKSWKKSNGYNEEKFKEELIDCWHFLINLTLTVMSDEEFYKKFIEKNDINYKRQSENY
jgi:dimeric dUTPase (all-alpha-NTP-PPase superfamily)